MTESAQTSALRAFEVRLRTATEIANLEIARANGERDAALARIATALAVYSNPEGDYARGGSAHEAVEAMVAALEGEAG
jgi:hypothetical protein